MIQRIKKPLKPIWYLIALAIISSAIVLQAARLTFPYLDNYSEDIKTFASNQLGAEVEFTSLVSSWYGLRPLIEVGELKVNANDGTPILEIQQARLQLDILSSLFYWVPVWRKVDIQGLRLQVSQSQDGAWSVASFGGEANKLSEPTEQELGWRYHSPNAIFLMANQVNILDADVTLEFHNQRRLVTSIPTITIENDGHFHRLVAKAELDTGANFDFIIEGVGRPSEAKNFFAKAYLSFKNFPVERLTTLLRQLPSIDSLPEQGGSSVDLQLWFDFVSPSQFYMLGNVSLVNKIPSDFAQKYYLDLNLDSQVTGEYSIERGLSINARDLQVDNQFNVSAATFNLHEDKLRVSLDSLPLKPVSAWLKRKIRHEKLQSVLSNLSPTGELLNVLTVIDLTNPKNFEIKANAIDVSVDPWNRVPALKNVSGYVESTSEQGYVLLNADNFELFADKVYDQAIVFDQAQGLVGWLLQPSQNNISVYGNDLAVTGNFGKANAFFRVDIPWVEGSNPSELTLQIGLQQGTVENSRQLLPRALPKNLSQWIQSSVKSGSVGQSGFLFRGGFADDGVRSIQLFADVDQGQLAFSHDWPQLNNIKGRFVVDTDRVVAEVKQAEFYPGDRLTGQVTWNLEAEKKLKVKAKGTSSAQSGLRFVNESWLESKTAGFFQDWTGSGNISLSTHLSLPILEPEKEPEIKVSTTFDNNQVIAKNLELNLDHVMGSMQYSSQQGFSSSNLQLELFGYPAFIRLGGEQVADDVLMLSANSRVGTHHLEQWLNLPLMTYATGEMGYELKLQVPFGTVDIEDSSARPELTITSNLVGTTVNLPEPLGKRAVQEGMFRMDVSFYPESVNHRYQYGDYIKSNLHVTEDKKVTGHITITDKPVKTASSMKKDELFVDVELNNTELEPWFAVLQRREVPSVTSAQVRGEQNVEAVSLPFNFSLNLKDAFYAKHSFGDMFISGSYTEDRINSHIKNDTVKGSVQIAKGSPIEIDLDYLIWPKEDQAEVDIGIESDKLDPLVGSDFSNIKAMNVQVHNLVYGGKSLGFLSFDLRPGANGLDFLNIVAFNAGINLGGSKEGQGAYLRWQLPTAVTPMSTRFIGRITGGNIKNLFDQWDLTANVENEYLKVDLDLLWPGSPLYYDMNRLSGNAEFAMERGVFTEQKVESATEVLRFLSIFNFNTWLERIQMGISDLNKKGYVFEKMSGELSMDKGIISFTKPIKISGTSSKFSLAGTIDYSNQTIDAELIATLPLGGNLTVAAALAAGLPAAAGVFLISKLFEKQVEQLSSIEYSIQGDLKSPVTKVVQQVENEVDTQPADSN